MNTHTNTLICFLTVRVSVYVAIVVVVAPSRTYKCPGLLSSVSWLRDSLCDWLAGWLHLYCCCRASHSYILWQRLLQQVTLSTPPSTPQSTSTPTPTPTSTATASRKWKSRLIRLQKFNILCIKVYGAVCVRVSGRKGVAQLGGIGGRLHKICVVCFWAPFWSCRFVWTSPVLHAAPFSCVCSLINEAIKGYMQFL